MCTYFHVGSADHREQTKTVDGASKRLLLSICILVLFAVECKWLNYIFLQANG